MTGENKEHNLKRFGADSAHILDTRTGQRHFGGRVFDSQAGECDEVNPTPSDRQQIIKDLGGPGACAEVLQRAFDVQGKPYDVRSVIDDLIRSGFTKKARWR